MNRNFSYYGYLVFALIVLIASWETSQADAALLQGPIPEQSIRLRILANSDSPEDQWIKRQVRDAIVEAMSRWVTEPDDLESARRAVREHLPELRKRVGEVLRQHGFEETFTMELGVVPFPTKMYGNVVYPAGDYEALRVKIGSGMGQNWWCVLFPPLCFVDIVGGEPVAQVDQNNGSGSTLSADDEESSTFAPNLQVRFFIVDLILGLIDWIRGIL
jgi:stage II sporulation protein R